MCNNLHCENQGVTMYTSGVDLISDVVFIWGEWSNMNALVWCTFNATVFGVWFLHLQCSQQLSANFQKANSASGNVMGRGFESYPRTNIKFCCFFITGSRKASSIQC